jgi:hypothetical protein
MTAIACLLALTALSLISASSAGADVISAFVDWPCTGRPLPPQG